MSADIEDEIESIVRRVVQPDFVREWWHLPLPRLGGMTADDLIEDGQGERLLAYVRTYLAPQGESEVRPGAERVSGKEPRRSDGSA